MERHQAIRKNKSADGEVFSKSGFTVNIGFRLSLADFFDCKKCDLSRPDMKISPIVRNSELERVSVLLVSKLELDTRDLRRAKTPLLQTHTLAQWKISNWFS